MDMDIATTITHFQKVYLSNIKYSLQDVALWKCTYIMATVWKDYITVLKHSLDDVQSVTPMDIMHMLRL